jgi:hypothetical protein
VLIRRAAGARWSWRPGRPAGGTAVLLACAALLAGCSSTAATQAASSTAATQAASSTPATPAAGSGANPSAAAAATAGGAGRTSAQQSASGQATGGGCTNLTATAAVKAQVTAAYRAMDPGLPPVLPEPGAFYYGTCAGTQYAATTFTLPAGDAKQGDQVAMQDDGSTIKYFTRPAAGSWHYAGSNDVPPAPAGCTSTPFVPAQLVGRWHDCPQQPVELPVLGAAWATGVQGYGQLSPTVVSNDGDPTGTITAITWTGWAGPTATGSGTSEYVAPGQITADGTEQTATIVAFDLGDCHGHRAYLAVEWYFPQHGQSFDPHNHLDACTGGRVGS